MTTHHTLRRTGAAALAALLLSVVVLAALAPTSARAASSVQIEARALVAGRYQVNGWAAIAVSLANEGVPTEGWLVAETASGVARRFVEMPSGARKVVTLYVRPEAFQRQIVVGYEEPNGRVEATTELRVLEQSREQIAIVGDPTGVLRPSLAAFDVGTRPEPLSLATADIPQRPEPLDGISAIVWAADSSPLDEEQRRGLERWVADGGQLVVVGGADWQARTAAFVDLLPATGLTSVDGVDQAALAAWAGSSTPAVASATVSTGELRDDAQPLVTAGDGTVLAAMRAVGAGRVILLGADVSVEEFRGWDGSPRLWARLLPGDALAQWFGGFPDIEGAANSMANALSNLPVLEIPPAELLLAIIAAYILLIGPISYAVLRRMDRREMAWVTAPLLVVLFTGGSYGIGLAMKGSDVILNQIALVRSSADGSAASVETYAGIFSPTRRTYDLRVDADALLAAIDSGFGAPREVGGAAEQGDPARLRELPVATSGFQVIRADGVVDHAPMLTVSWTSEEGSLVGTVTNVGDEPLADVAYVSTSGGELIGDLEPGARAEFTVDHRNLNGSSASDQVYGFGGFDATSQEQRRIAARRSVIDALVGYGGFPGPLGQQQVVGGRGPYLVGWRTGEGPMPIVAEDVQVQRYAEIAEVVAVRPVAGGGEVTVGPAQMSVALIASEGQVESVGPGMTSIGNGSATFSIALPLEMSGMRVSEAEIIVGPDPSMVLQDPGGFGGFWPPGMVAEVLDPTTGAWTELGDISLQSRFDIPDAATAVSQSGRIEVRITGSEIDPNFGMPSVFVSAQVGGVLDR